jgi:hypothetical protein
MRAGSTAMPDSQAQLTAEDEWQKIVALAGDDDLEKHQIGVAYNRIVDEKLAQSAGFKSAKEFFDSKLAEAAKNGPTEQGLKLRELSRATLSAYGNLAKAFSAHDFSEHGFNRLLLLQRCRKAGSIDPTLPPGLVRLQVPEADGSVGGRAFGDCSVRDLRAALRLLRGSAAERLSDADEATLDALNQAVDSVLGADQPGNVRATFRGEQVTIAIDGVPLTRLRATLQAMINALPAV